MLKVYLKISKIPFERLEMVNDKSSFIMRFHKIVSDIISDINWQTLTFSGCCKLTISLTEEPNNLPGIEDVKSLTRIQVANLNKHIECCPDDYVLDRFRDCRRTLADARNVRKRLSVFNWHDWPSLCRLHRLIRRCNPRVSMEDMYAAAAALFLQKGFGSHEEFMNDLIALSGE